MIGLLLLASLLPALQPVEVPTPRLDCRAYQQVVQSAAGGDREASVEGLRAVAEPFLDERILTDRGQYRSQTLSCLGRAPWRLKRAAALVHLDCAIRYRREHRTVRSAIEQLIAQDLLRQLGRAGGSAARFAVEAYLALGYALQESAEPATAVDFFERALGLNPRLPEAQLGIGSVYEKMGRYQAAEPALEAAANGHDRGEALLRLGVTRSRLGNDRGARACLEQAAETAAPPFVRQTALAELGLIALREQRFGEAAQLLERAIAADPSEQSSYVALSYAYDRLGELRKSLEVARRALIEAHSERSGYRYLYDRLQARRSDELMEQLWNTVRAEGAASAAGAPGGAR
jgi:tetratricopeptide (TPR) repeat protein